MNNSEKQKPETQLIDQITVSPEKKGTCSVDTSCSFDGPFVKMSYLRAKEQKLKKWEDDLKLEEKTLSETS